MRRKNVLRFLTIAFIAGAFVGLVSGLAFGSGRSGTPKKQTVSTVAAATTGTTQARQNNSASSVGSGSTPNGMTPDKARAIGANEMGKIPVLMYQTLGAEENASTVTPAHFRDDISLLKSEGYYPVTVRDLASGNIDIPAGKSPVVITFDDSSPNQYKILEDGTIDPDCAVAILQQAARAGDWAERASFYPQIQAQPTEKNLFGQKDKQQEKLRNLVQWGYEIGSRTVTHANLQKASSQKVAEELAQSKATLEHYIGNGYKISSLSLPFGAYPASDSMLTSGQYDDKSYTYTAALRADGGPSISPFSTKFAALHITRVDGNGNGLKQALDDLKKHAPLRYVSDGDPTTVSAPKDLAAELGTVRKDLGRPVVRY
jgi:peptidoglycan/xylan/chitin deacetylase (PgdA/CDA1 family)